jgi:predicted CoA-substrate-specific enzyme activase
MTARCLGVDAGSTTFKAVALDEHGRVLAATVQPMHPRIEEQASRELAALRARTGAPESTPVGATGYGRKRVGAGRVLTEITCHAKGSFHAVGRPHVLVDLGGQDTKVIRVGPDGAVTDFAMNDKCAAGTGRFLEVILGRLHLPFDQVAELLAGATPAVPVSSTCTVFAESEVISLLAEGASTAGILKGVHQSLAARVAALAGPLPPEVPIYMSGGVALNPGMVAALTAALRRPVTVLPDPQLVGALGAALSVR